MILNGWFVEGELLGLGIVTGYERFSVDGGNRIKRNSHLIVLIS